MKLPNSSRQREAQFRRDRLSKKPDAKAAPAGANGKPPDKLDKQKRRKYLRVRPLALALPLGASCRVAWC
jgi:hypothetical protein